MTQPFTPAELDAIRAAAKAATPGPWFHPGTRQPWIDQASDPKFLLDKCGDQVLSRNWKEVCSNFAHIATSNPASVLRLVEQARPMKWQPIETANRNTDLLLYFPEIHRGPTNKLTHLPMVKVGKVIDYPSRKPSHWMPLPKPPEAK